MVGLWGKPSTERGGLKGHTLQEKMYHASLVSVSTFIQADVPSWGGSREMFGPPTPTPTMASKAHSHA